MAKLFYARTSSTGQQNSLDAQIERAKAEGVKARHIYAEKVSGKNAKNRPELQRLLGNVREGDVVLVSKLDRIARSMLDLMKILETFEAEGVGFKVLDQEGIDTTTPTGKLTLQVLGSVAEFERSLIDERRTEGIKRYRERLAKEGKKPGRTPKQIDLDKLQALRDQGLSVADAARELGVSRRTAYRAIQRET